MTEQDIENIKAIARAGSHIGSGMNAVDYYIMYGTGEKQKREEERAVWNREVEAKKAKAKEAKP